MIQQKFLFSRWNPTEQKQGKQNANMSWTLGLGLERTWTLLFPCFFAIVISIWFTVNSCCFIYLSVLSWFAQVLYGLFSRFASCVFKVLFVSHSVHLCLISCFNLVAVVLSVLLLSHVPPSHDVVFSSVAPRFHFLHHLLYCVSIPSSRCPCFPECV